MKNQLEKLVAEWHEAGREPWQKDYQYVNYDQDQKKTIKEKKKYFYLDNGHSGVFMVDKKSGFIFYIKGYGVPNKKKMIGIVGIATGKDLFNRQRG